VFFGGDAGLGLRDGYEAQVRVLGRGVAQDLRGGVVGAVVGHHHLVSVGGDVLGEQGAEAGG